MFIPDDCPHLVDIKKSLPKHKRELYKELELPKIDPGYQCFLQALLSKAEEQLKNEREQVIDIVEYDKSDDNNGPQFESFRRNLKEHGRSYAPEGERNGVPLVVKYEEEEEEEESSLNDVYELGHHSKMKKSDVQKLNRHTSQMRPRSGVNGSMQNRTVRKIGSGRGKELLTKNSDTNVLRLNHKQALSSKKFNAETSRVSKAILVDIENSSEPEHDRTVRLGKRVVDQVQSGSRRVVDRRTVDKGKSVIQVEDPVEENTNQRPNPKNHLERIDKTPNAMENAHVTRNLRKVVKGKNVVREDDMDQGITLQLRNVEFSESSRPQKKICKNNQRKESDDEAASDVEILCCIFRRKLRPLRAFKNASQHNGRANVRSELRKNVLNVLKKPFDNEQYHRLQEAVKKESYLETYPDLGAILFQNRYIKAKCLTILRGFFFWLQNLTQEGAFKPWNDRQCLAVKQESE